MRALACSIEKRTRLEPGWCRRRGHREAAALVHRCAPIPSVLVHGVIVEIEFWAPMVVKQTPLGHAHHALEAREAGLLRRYAGAHLVDDKERARDLDVRFPPAGRACRADRVVRVLARADDRAVADATGDLPRLAARRRAGGDVAGGRDGAQVDSAGRERDGDVLAMVEPYVVGIQVGFPAQPVLATLVGEQ